MAQMNSVKLNGGPERRLRHENMKIRSELKTETESSLKFEFL